jgi:hypothetical protein
VETIQQLTDNVQAEALANLGLCADLTFIRSRVSNLRGAHFEGPLVGPVRVQRLEALVISVRENAHCQDVQVSLADPGHGSVAEVPDPAVQVGALPHRGRHVAAGRVVEVRLRERLLPVGGVMLYHGSWNKRECSLLFGQVPAAYSPISAILLYIVLVRKTESNKHLGTLYQTVP